MNELDWPIFLFIIIITFLAIYWLIHIHGKKEE